MSTSFFFSSRSSFERKLCQQVFIVTENLCCRSLLGARGTVVRYLSLKNRCDMCILPVGNKEKLKKNVYFLTEKVMYIYTQYIHMYQYLSNINLLFFPHSFLFPLPSFSLPSFLPLFLSPSLSLYPPFIHSCILILLPKYYIADIRIKSKAFRIRMTYM